VACICDPPYAWLGPRAGWPGGLVSGRVDRVRRDGPDPVRAGSYRVGPIAFGATDPTRFGRVRIGSGPIACGATDPTRFGRQLVGAGDHPYRVMRPFRLETETGEHFVDIEKEALAMMKRE
jgi:hypothetical protein